MKKPRGRITVSPETRTRPRCGPADYAALDQPEMRSQWNGGMKRVACSIGAMSHDVNGNFAVKKTGKPHGYWVAGQGGPAEFAAPRKRETAKWARVIRAAGIRAD